VGSTCIIGQFLSLTRNGVRISGCVFHMRLVFGEGVTATSDFQCRHKLTGEPDADKTTRIVPSARSSLSPFASFAVL
jgi:hypothetical protein